MAYCLDEAVWLFGTTVRERVSEAAKSTGKRDDERKQQARAENKLREILGLPKRFRSIAPTQEKASNNG